MKKPKKRNVPDCPRCELPDYVVKNGSRKLKSVGRLQKYRCRRCRLAWTPRSGTAMHRLQTEPLRIASALHARSEGVGLRATARLVKTSPRSVQRWEQRLAQRTEELEDPLPATFTPFIESDELYTKVHHNRPAWESPGWTLISLERHSRYWVGATSGRREAELFENGIRVAWERAGKRPGVWVSDGERQYERVLLTLSKQRYRERFVKVPRGTWPGTRFVLMAGLLVARKIKGGRRRRYERSERLHPQTPDVPDEVIHGNHTEAFNASLRRRCSAFRRRCNTYAKGEAGLTHALAVQRFIYNWARPHPGLASGTTPAMAVGLATHVWSLVELLTA